MGRAVNAEVAKFKPGDCVAVKFEDRRGHIRTPWYIRGKTGWIERVYGDFPNPESLAFGHDGEPGHDIGPDAALIYELEVVSIPKEGDPLIGTGSLGHGLDGEYTARNSGK